MLVVYVRVDMFFDVNCKITTKKRDNSNQKEDNLNFDLNVVRSKYS